MASVDEYIDRFTDEKKEWLTLFINHMRENFPNVHETISYQIPTYKFNKCYIAFSVAKNHFSFHTLDFEMIEELKKELPKAKFGRGCIKVKYTEKNAIPILLEYCRRIIENNIENRN